jgi:hypothetical protein
MDLVKRCAKAGCSARHVRVGRGLTRVSAGGSIGGIEFGRRTNPRVRHGD